MKFTVEVTGEFVQIAGINKEAKVKLELGREKYFSLFTWGPLCFSTLLDWFWEWEVWAWCQCPRACPLTHCAKRVNATKRHQHRLWTVKPSMAGTRASVPSPCRPLREQQKDAAWQHVDFDLFYLSSQRHSLRCSSFDSVPHSVVYLWFWFTCWIVSCDCLQWRGFAACDSLVRARLFWDAFVFGFNKCGTVKSSSIIPCHHMVLFF